MDDALIHGRFVWHELETDDPDAGAAFYTALVGWGTATQDPGSGPYRMFTQDGVAAAGLMDLPEEAKQMGAIPCWLPYVGVDDVDATIAQAAALGAMSPIESFDVPTVGRIGLILDPQGAALGLFAPFGDDPPASPPPGVGTPAWHELATTDHAAAMRFYAEVFGWAEIEAMDMGGGAIYQLFGLGGEEPLGGIFNKPPEMPQAAWNVYWEVADVDAAAPRIPGLGGQVTVAPMEVPGGGRILMGVDPQGAAFALSSHQA
jgi:hypothetical protein